MAKKLEHTDFGQPVRDRNSWKYSCTVYLPDGTTKRAQKCGKTKKLAKEALKARIEEIGKEFEASKKKTKVTYGTDSLTEQLKEYAVLKQSGKVRTAGKGFKKRSIDDKNELIRNLVEPYEIGKKKVDEISRGDIIKWLDKLKAEGKSEKRQKGAYNLLTDYYNNYYCMEVDTDFISPAVGFKFHMKKSKANPMMVMDNEETALYLKACEEMGDKADVLQFLLYTYCREGEASTLTWSDWDYKDRLHIHKTWSKDENGKSMVDNSPKTPSSERYIRLPEQAVTLLTARYAQVEGTDAGKPGAWIFPAVRDKSKPISESTIYGLHKQVLKIAGIKPNMRVHDLRHSGISFNIRNSQTDCISAISKQAGHSSRAITENIYEEVLDSQKVELAKTSSKIYESVCPW
ncbi:MAG: site-specific integrase [Clostridiales bacterium]|nr:site-specific integrase [Clostridiales bacterium]